MPGQRRRWRGRIDMATACGPVWRQGAIIRTSFLYHLSHLHTWDSHTHTYTLTFDSSAVKRACMQEQIELLAQKSLVLLQQSHIFTLHLLSDTLNFSWNEASRLQNWSELWEKTNNSHPRSCLMQHRRVCCLVQASNPKRRANELKGCEFISIANTVSRSASQKDNQSANRLSPWAYAVSTAPEPRCQSHCES